MSLKKSLQLLFLFFLPIQCAEKTFQPIDGRKSPTTPRIDLEELDKEKFFADLKKQYKRQFAEILMHIILINNTNKTLIIKGNRDTENTTLTLFNGKKLQ